MDLFKFKLPAPKISPNCLKQLFSQGALYVLSEPNIKPNIMHKDI